MNTPLFTSFAELETLAKIMYAEDMPPSPHVPWRKLDNGTRNQYRAIALTSLQECSKYCHDGAY